MLNCSVLTKQAFRLFTLCFGLFLLGRGRPIKSVRLLQTERYTAGLQSLPIPFPNPSRWIPNHSLPAPWSDRISGLPDEILHTILSRLPSPAPAARTSVLSRHWQGARLGPHAMPDLVFDGNSAPATTPSALLDSIDAALELPAAPTLRSLKIDVSGVDRCHVPAHRISPWLRFASQRVAGQLHLRHGDHRYGDNMEELALPVYERATEIDLQIAGVFLRPLPTGSFSLLTDLSIDCGQMDGGELGRAVSSPHCPRLRKLRLVLLKLEPVREVSIHSETLKRFKCALFRVGKLEVTAPMLQEISITTAPEACIVAAPKLEEVDWFGTFDPDRHQFVVAGCHFRCLSIVHGIVSSTRLMERFDTVSELVVSLRIQEGIERYMTFLKEMDKLPICETLVVVLLMDHHAFTPTVLHLLKGRSCIRKFKLMLSPPSELPSCIMLECPCHLPENYRLDGITFDSLEEIGISSFTGSAKQVEFVEELLSRCNMVILKRVNFMVLSATAPVSLEIKEAVQKIRSICHPNIIVQLIT